MLRVCPVYGLSGASFNTVQYIERSLLLFVTSASMRTMFCCLRRNVSGFAHCLDKIH